MGFDIECIIDIHSYPGEYFCPVCRTLVYPNEAFQAQCTHLYCKPCLAHIANGSKACPYDGYLVTESDSKPLLESDKVLMEKVGKVKVHCLFFRSGCTWVGTLSDCTSHCSSCSFGNSPVICNRCGVQIVHRQVHDHAQICPGGYDGQQAAVGAAGLTKSGTATTTVTAAPNQNAVQTGTPVTQAQNPQNANMQANANANAHTPVVASSAMPGQEQWYQQQYQQYYQQYAGYNPYQQQQYYPVQQNPFQQHQAVLATQPQAPAQPQPQAQPHLQLQPPPQTNPATQSAQQPRLQPQTQGQAQPSSQPQHQMLPQAQAQANAPVQALAPNYQVNQQQYPHPAMRPPTQIPSQALPPPPPPHSQPSQPPQFPQAAGMRPPAQHPQVPQYNQGQGQMQGSQSHPQPHMYPQTQAYIQPSSQSNVPSQSQPQPYQSHSQLPVFHSQTNQTAAPPALPQAPHPPVPPVSGHHSYQQQKMQPGAPQQHVVPPHAPSGSLHPAQGYGQVPQQPTPIQPPHSHGSFSQQQPSAPLPLQSQVAGIPLAQHQQFLPHGQQPSYPHRPVMQPVQQAPPHNYPQQQQFSAPFQGQIHQQGHLPQQPPMQSHMQMRPPAPPQLQQSQNYPGIPVIPNQGIPLQNHPVPSSGFGISGHSVPAQGDSTSNQNKKQNETVQEIRTPSKLLDEKRSEGDSLKEVNGTLAKDAYDFTKDGLVKSVEKADPMGSREQSNEGKPFGVGGVEKETRKEEVRTLPGSVQPKQADPEDLMKLSKTASLSSGNFGDETISANSLSSAEGRTLPPQSHGSQHEKPQAQLQEQPSSKVGPHGPGSLPKSFESLAPPLPFESQYGSQHVVRPGEVAVSMNQMSGSGEWRPLARPHTEERNLSRTNGVGARDESSKPFSNEHFNPHAREPTHTFDQASRFLDKPLDGHSYGAVSKLDPSAGGPNSRFLPNHPSGGRGRGDMFGHGPVFGHHDSKPFTHHSPGRDSLGLPSREFGGPSSFPRGTSDINSREAHRFGEGARYFNPSDSVRNPLHDGSLRPLPGHLRRGDFDNPENPRFGEHRVPGLPHNQIGGDDIFGRDVPGHLMKGKFSGPGYLSGHFNIGETAGRGAFPRPPFSESVRGDMPSFLHLSEPPMRNNYPYHGMANAAHFSGGVDSSDPSRKRKAVSNGWCRICEFDCETVERLEMHSQTREHQNMAMDMVKRIKLLNEKQRAGGGHMVHEGGSRTRKVGSIGRGNNP